MALTASSVAGTAPKRTRTSATPDSTDLSTDPASGISLSTSKPAIVYECGSGMAQMYVAFANAPCAFTHLPIVTPEPFDVPGGHESVQRELCLAFPPGIVVIRAARREQPAND